MSIFVRPEIQCRPEAEDQKVSEFLQQRRIFIIILEEDTPKNSSKEDDEETGFNPKLGNKTFIMEKGHYIPKDSFFI